MLIKAIILFLVLVVVSTSSVFSARKIIISTEKNTISNSDEMLISASASGFMDNEEFYIKGAFFKEGSTNYFGFTKSGNDWIKNSAKSTSQRQVNFGNWDRKIVVKNDPDDTGFGGSDKYKIKVGFYYITSKGNLSSVKWSENTIPISISFTPTQLPIKTSTTSDYESTDEVEAYLNSDDASDYVNFESNTSNSQAKSDKISSSPRTASSYAEIKPITEAEEEEEGSVLGEEIKDNTFAVSISAFGVFLLVFAGALLVRRRIREGKLF